MRSRHVVGMAFLCGAMGILGGQTAKAQAPNSERFVRLLLINENKLIQADSKALSSRNSNIAKLNSASSNAQIKKLSKTLTRLNAQILSLTLRLQSSSVQALNTASRLGNPSLINTALANLMIVQQLSVQANLTPATESQ